MYERLRASMKDAPVVKFGDYDYFVHPITDGIPLGDPRVFEEAVEGLHRLGSWKGNKIVTVESMGFPLAAALSVKTGLPYVFVRKRKYGLPGEVVVQQVTGYSEKALYINNVGEGDQVIFVDDVLSTGGTLRAVVKGLRSTGAEVLEGLIVFNKSKEKASLEKELGLPIKTLLSVAVVDGKMVEWRG